MSLGASPRGALGSHINKGLVCLLVLCVRLRISSFQGCQRLMAGNSWFRLVWGDHICLRVKENIWESSSEIYSAQYKPLEQKVGGACYDSFRLHNTNGHYNGLHKRKKTQMKQKAPNKSKKQAEPEKLVGSPPRERFLLHPGCKLSQFSTENVVMQALVFWRSLVNWKCSLAKVKQTKSRCLRGQSREKWLKEENMNRGKLFCCLIAGFKVKEKRWNQSTH